MIKKLKIRGFTLIEMIIVIVLLGIIATFAGNMIYQATKSTHASYDTAEIMGQGRLALFRMSDEIHKIRTATATDLDISSANSLTFTTTDGRTINYHLSGRQLMRNTHALANNITALNFLYRDNNGAITSTIAAVRYIDINFSLQLGNHNTTLQSTVFIRNAA